MERITNDVHDVIVNVDDELDAKSVKMVTVVDDEYVEWPDEIRMNAHRPYFVHMHLIPNLEFVNDFDVIRWQAKLNVILAYEDLSHVERLQILNQLI